jgi:hypothetical protein
MKELKTKIINLDYISVGTVSKSYKQCGKASCRCAQSDKHWHGPYYIWTRKEKGKTITKSLSDKQARRCMAAIKNMKRLNHYIQEWKTKSIKYIGRIE